jgi:hypothetical protein
MSDDNEMDPGEVPEHLSALSQVEEILIARVHLRQSGFVAFSIVLATPFAS